MHYSRSKSAQQVPEKHSKRPSERSEDGVLSASRGVPLVLMRNNEPPLAVDKETGEVIAFTNTGSELKILPLNSVSESRKARYKLLSYAANILKPFFGSSKKSNGFRKVHRTVDCHSVITSSFVQIYKSQEHNTAFYGGLATCGSVWSCPVCSTKICERRSHELRIAFNKAEAMGLEVSLWTFTAPHTASDSISDLLPMVSDGLQHFFRGNTYKKFRSRFGVKGRIRSLEVRYGVNGWHPHFHLIFFSERSLLDQKDWALSRWQSMCIKVGLSCPNDYGLDIRDGSKAGEYINKFSPNGEIRFTSDGDQVTWDLADEATKGMKKGSKGNSLSPWGILDFAGTHSDKLQRFRYRSLFFDYSKAFHGKSQLHWGGLKKFFDIDDKTDEQLCTDKDDTAKLLAHLLPAEWKEVIQREQRAILLDICESGGQKALCKFLFSLKCNGGDYIDFSSDFYSRL